jgi:acetyl esterase/lipase
MYAAYFPDVSRRAEALASPALDERLGDLSPILLLTGDLDSLASEQGDFSRAVTAQGGRIEHVRYADSDRGFTHGQPLDVARDAIDRTANFIAAACRPGASPGG